MNLVILTILAFGNIPLYYLYFRLLYSDSDEFFEGIRYWFTPDFWSFLQGEWGRDFWAELKLGAFLFLCGGTVMGEYGLLTPFLN